jgi:outer membrane protein TolC
MRRGLGVILSLALAGSGLAQERPTLQLSLEEVVKRALENNLDIQVEKFNPEASAIRIREVEGGAYDTNLSATLRTTSATSGATSFLSGGQKVNSDTAIWNFGATQYVKSGGTFALTFSNNKVDTDNAFATLNPSFGSTLTATLTQPLLRNFKIDSTRNSIRVTKRNKEISDVQFRQIVTYTVAQVKKQYYDLIAAIDNLDAQRKSLALARKLLEENQIKVRVGTMAPLDVVQAESEVASREEGVITAEQAIRETEDALKRAIFPRNDEQIWSLQVVPTDRAAFEAVTVDVDAAIKQALEGRTDLVVARKQLETIENNAQLARNQVLPAFNLNASYGGSGVGGTQLKDPATGQPLATPIPGGYGDALGTINDFPTWYVGVTMSYPLFNKAAKAQDARTKLALDQARTSLARLEMAIASEVRSAARSVETNLKRVASTRAAKTLQAQRLDAEEKKFAAGMSTNFLVTQAQRDLAVAEFNELRAIADYRKSVVDFERIREAGAGGGSGSITVTISGSGTTGGGSGATLAQGGGN